MTLIDHYFTSPDEHPYDGITFVKRDIVQTNAAGETIFELRGAEFPDFWDQNAAVIAATKYFRPWETSLVHLIDRVVNKYVEEGSVHGHLTDHAEIKAFRYELTYMLVHQMFAFNSPVWFNVGVKDIPQQVSACFLLSVRDSMESILNWYREEGLIFKGGSGAGANLSCIRSSKERISGSNGTASGPVSFMRGADASAGTIKSGGAVRRAAKLVALNVNHPDIEEFIDVKVREEEKIAALRDAGFDMSLGGADMSSVQYQNANNSVVVSDEFMRAVEEGESFALRAVTTGEVLETVSAKAIMRKMAEAAWVCADPGIQYGDTINSWHTLPSFGRINTSNPCGEYLSIDNSSCNLGSINLLKLLKDDGSFDFVALAHISRVAILAMDISVSFGYFPTEAIAENTRKFRQLGLGFTNLGALLMSKGLAYDSDEGRELAAVITSFMAAEAHIQSARIAGKLGPHAGWGFDGATHLNVVRRHADSALDPQDGLAWTEAVRLAEAHGLRNAQLTLCAPTGTISFLLGADTTGIEPDFSLVKFKRLVGGGSMQIVNRSVRRALESLGYQEQVIEEIEAHIQEHGSVIDAPGLAAEDYAVFDCAVGERAISPEGHLKMMAAVQPFLSGSISKTINLPESATPEDIEKVYFDGWKMGLKDLSVYRDGSKTGQPLNAVKKDKAVEAPETPEAPEVMPAPTPARKRLPKARQSVTTSFSVGGADGYMTVGQYEDGSPGELFLKLGKQGTTLAGMMDAFSIAVSVGLQYGVPLETFVAKFTNMQFAPSGMTDDKDLRMASSLVDYVFRRMAIDHMDFDTRAAYGVYTNPERARYLETGSYEPLTDEQEAPGAVPSPPAPKPSTGLTAAPVPSAADLPVCGACGGQMRPSGSCHVCEGCGNTSGCS